MNELMDVELNELVSLVSEIDYENDGFQLLQRAGAMAFNDLVEELTAGDLIYTKPGEFHSIRNNGEGDVMFLAFVIN